MLTKDKNSAATAKKPMELLAPAGGFEQLEAAILFGADAVYLAADRFGMRARAANFSMEELPRAVKIAHDANVDVHLTCNVMISESSLDELPQFFEDVDRAGVDALIIGDLGAFSLAKKYAPNCNLHVSTQASVSNSESAKMWYELGASRIVCAREMTLADIAKMRSEIPDDLEIEAFVHGAQCMAISGRCLISSYLTGRSANQGHCTQPCRWNYALEEEKRPGMQFGVFEDAVIDREELLATGATSGEASNVTDEATGATSSVSSDISTEASGTYIMNAKDLSMIAHLDELWDAGVNSLKIEGRNKKAFYVATVVGAYRRALNCLYDEHANASSDAYNANIADFENELLCSSHRPFSTGFYYGNPEQATDFDGYEQETIHVGDFICTMDQFTSQNGNSQTEMAVQNSLLIRCRNRFAVGDEIEILIPGKAPRKLNIKQIIKVAMPKKGYPDDLSLIDFESQSEAVEVANVACNLYIVAVDDENLEEIPKGSFVRMRQYRRSARSDISKNM